MWWLMTHTSTESHSLTLLPSRSLGCVYDVLANTHFLLRKPGDLLVAYLFIFRVIYLGFKIKNTLRGNRKRFGKEELVTRSCGRESVTEKECRNRREQRERRLQVQNALHSLNSCATTLNSKTESASSTANESNSSKVP